MNEQNEGADPGEVDGPAEDHESDGGHVVKKHLPKVLSLHVVELGDEEGPVEAQLDHVVPPDAAVNVVVWVVVPAVPDVPKPGLVPQDEDPVGKDGVVVESAPPEKTVEVTVTNCAALLDGTFQRKISTKLHSFVVDGIQNLASLNCNKSRALS